MQVGIADLKAHLSQYLKRVESGEEIIVADRGRPVARLVPTKWQNDEEEDARLLDLQRRGVIRLGLGYVPAEVFEMERPEDPHASVRAALEAERSEGY